MSRLGRQRHFKPLIRPTNIFLTASIAAAVGTAAGAATVTGVSNGAVGVGSALGVATVTGVGASIAAAVGRADGVAVVGGVGIATGIIQAVGSATGAATAAGAATSTAAAHGTATGTASVSGEGQGALPGLTKIDLQFAIGDGAFYSGGFNSNAFGGSAWTSVMSDTRTDDPIVLDYGCQANGPSDRVADTGTLTFTLNNAADNTGGIQGFYSPLNASRRSGHDINIPVRLALTLNGQVYQKFVGRLAEINPEAGKNGTLKVPCTAVDLMDDWAANDVPAIIPVMQNQDAGTMLSTLFGTLPPDLQATGYAIEPGVDILPYAFHDPTRTKIREQLIDIVMSDLGFACLQGFAASYGGGIFFFSNRHAASQQGIRTSLINQFSVDDGFTSTMNRDDLASSVEVFVYPSAIDTAIVDIFQLDGAPLLVLPFETTILRLPFRTTERPNQPIAALEVLAPIPYTDYTVNSQQDGLGLDLTGNFSVTHVYDGGGTEAVLTVTNLGELNPDVALAAFERPGPAAPPIPGFITLLKGRGRGLYISEASARVDINTKYGRRPLQVVMPIQSDVNVATDVAHFFSNIYKNTYGQVTAIKFCAQKSDPLLQDAVIIEPGDLVYIQEDVTGIADTFRVQGVRLEINEGVMWCTWRLANIQRQQFWILGQAGSSEIDQTTILGF